MIKINYVVDRSLEYQTIAAPWSKFHYKTSYKSKNFNLFITFTPSGLKENFQVILTLSLIHQNDKL